MVPPTHIHSATAAVDGASLQTLWRSFAMIIVSEIGDKTFLIAAILAMRHPRRLVFSGAFASLVLMSLLSAELGQILPHLIPRRWTQACAAVLFLVFGAKTFREGRAMKDGDDAMQEEMREAKEDIEGDQAVRDAEDVDALELGEKVVPLEAMERGCGYAEGCARRRSPTERSTSPGLPGGCAQKGLAAYTESTRKFFSYLLGPVFVQAFVLTFLGEWGDRSQISTIALAAADNVYVVALGTVVGHSCCTTLAVVGGRYISTTKVSVKHITLSASALFLLFGVVYLYEAVTALDSDGTVLRAAMMTS